MKAHCLIRREPHYRLDAFVQGLRVAGYTVDLDGASQSVAPGDLLVIWNRYGHYHDLATRFEKLGGTVLVVENGYLGVDRGNRQRYAIARAGHNGSGLWPKGDGERWAALGIELKPWRTEGAHIVVCPNRSFGRPDMIMPNTWVEMVMAKLKRLTDRPIRIRPHPGNDPPKIPLADDLRNAWACIVWTSSAGCEALVSGIPTYALGPYWIAKASALHDLATINDPPLLDRMPGLHRLAWGQWHLNEITRGIPFQSLRDGASPLAGCL